MAGVTSPNTVSFGGSPAAMVAPDLVTQQLQLARRQQLIDYLKQQALAPQEQQTITGSGPTRVVPNSPIAGIAKMLGAYMASKNQDTLDSQSMDINRQLAQRYAQILGGGSPMDPSTASTSALGVGAGNGSVGPTNQNAQTMDNLTAGTGADGSGGQGGQSAFSMGNLLRGGMIEQLGGAPAAGAYWDRTKLPDAVKTNNYYGLSPASVGAAMRRENAAKGQTLVRNGSTLGTTNEDGSFTPFFTAPDTKDNANITWQNGRPVAEQIQGLTTGIQSAARARTAGEGSVLPYSGVDAQGNPLPITSRTAAATQGQTGPVAPGMPAAPQAGGPSTNDPASILQAELAKAQDRLANPAKYMAPVDLQQDPNGVQFRQRAANDIAGIQREMARLPRQAQGAGPGAAAGGGGPIYGAPPLGTTSNADTAQKASAESMHASYSRLQGSNATAQNALDVIDKMQALAAKKNAILTAGPLGTNQSAINPDAAEYEKQRANLITQLAAQNGTNGTDAGRALTADSVPDFGKPKSAIADGLGTLRNQTVVQQLKTNFLTPIYQSGDSKKYTTMENAFDQHISPSLVPLLAMPPGPQRAAQLQAAQKNPAMRAKLNWAAENGLLK